VSFIGNNRNLPAKVHETSPLFVGLLGISIPVGLLAVAAVTESIVVSVFAVLAMLTVAAATLSFVIWLATDRPDSDAHGA
jgi:fumarate reductase subunit D